LRLVLHPPVIDARIAPGNKANRFHPEADATFERDGGDRTSIRPIPARRKSRLATGKPLRDPGSRRYNVGRGRWRCDMVRVAARFRFRPGRGLIVLTRVLWVRVLWSCVLCACAPWPLAASAADPAPAASSEVVATGQGRAAAPTPPPSDTPIEPTQTSAAADRDGPPAPDRRPHGMVEVGVGTNGYRRVAGAVTAPIGADGQIGVAIDDSQFGRR
jgi:hypothetical protein